MDASRGSRGRVGVYAVVALALLAGALALYTWATLSFDFSTGERVGYVQKFSRKGWLCKTWEGELAMVTMPGAIPEKFYFSTRSEAIAAEVNRSLGKRVRISYAQHRFVPTNCFGETEYFATSAQVVE